MIALTNIPDFPHAWNQLQKRYVRIAYCQFGNSLSTTQVIRGCITDLNTKASQQALPDCLSSELRTLLVLSTHRIEKARDIASKFLNRLITSFPSLMCDPPLVFAILEVLTLLRRSCENEFTDEVRTNFKTNTRTQLQICSITLSMNFIRRDLASRCSLPMITRLVTTSWASYTAMPIAGSSSPLVVPQ